MDSMSAMLQVASYYQKQSAQVNKEGKTKALNLLIKRWRFAHYQLQLNQSDSVLSSGSFDGREKSRRKKYGEDKSFKPLEPNSTFIGEVNTRHKTLNLLKNINGI